MGDSKQTSIEGDQPDDTEPTPERQAELQAAYEANVAAGKAPYAGVEIRTRGELQWVMRERSWSGALGEALPTDFRGAVLRGTNLSGVVLSGTNLAGADLNAADLSGASLHRSNLSGADLFGANLTGAKLLRADLSAANLFGATLRSAVLFGANLSGADLSAATFPAADLRTARMSVETVLSGASFAPSTRLADVIWNAVPLAGMEWEPVRIVGDEAQAHKRMDPNGERKLAGWRRAEYEEAVRAYRLLAYILRSQGVNEHADRFAYRAQVCQRIVARRQHHYLRYIGSLLLDLLAGYGYRPGRAILLYLAIIVWFANFYVWASNGIITFGMPPSHVSPLAWHEALILSVSSFHGRGFQPFQNLNDPVAALAGMQAVFGLVIEVSFIATFTQRFFGK